jgi:AsmA protein
MKLKLSNLQAGLRSAGDGIIRLEPLAVDLYDGNFNGAVIIDVTGKAPQYRINTQLSKVQIEPLLFDYMQSRFISGQMNAKFDIGTAGDRLSQFKQNLNGTGNLAFRDGALSFDLREKTREAKARLRRQAYNPPSKKPTTFSAITAGLNIVDGTVNNKDLEVRAGHLFISGAGQYALPSDLIDYTVTLLFSEDPTSQDQALAEFYDIPIRLHLKGELAKLDYLDIVRSGLTGAVSGRARKEVEEKKQEVKQELKQKLDEKVTKEKKDELKDRLRKKLGGD